MTAGLVQVVRMQSEDAEALSRYAREIVYGEEVYNQEARDRTTRKYTAQGFLDMAAGDPDAILVARIDSDIAGFCSSRYFRGYILMGWCAVRLEHRRRGVATALLKALEETARPRGCQQIWCDTPARIAAARALLSKCGYRLIRTVPSMKCRLDYDMWDRVLF